MNSSEKHKKDLMQKARKDAKDQEQFISDLLNRNLISSTSQGRRLWHQLDE